MFFGGVSVGDIVLGAVGLEEYSYESGIMVVSRIVYLMVNIVCQLACPS